MDTTAAEADLCPICEKGLDDAESDEYAALRDKGADKINSSSQQRGRPDIVARPNQRVHTKCRREWTNSKTIRSLSSSEPSPVKKKSRHISIGQYDSGKDCLFCGRGIVTGTHGRDESFSEVHNELFPSDYTEPMQKTFRRLGVRDTGSDRMFW